MSSSPSPRPRYQETLRVPVGWWLLGAVGVVAVWWTFFVATHGLVALGAGLAAGALVVAALVSYGGVRLVADADGFHAGRAWLDWDHVGLAEPLDPDQTRLALGVGADARAFLLVRAYCGTAVRVFVDDPADPAPYWLVSTRHPAELAASLRTGVVKD
jgi:Protein of unknown function (DUF3093)